MSKFLKKNLSKIFPDHWSFMLGEIALYSFIVLLLTIIEAYGALFSRTFAIPGIGHWAFIGFIEDLFAVGVLLYRLLCNGHHPFPDAMPAIGKPVTDPRTIRSDLHPGLAEFLIKACAPASADRYCTAAQMQVALRDIRADL